MTDPIYNPPSFFGPNAIKLPSQYRSIKVLGAGSYGEVVKCWKKDINQPVAVKIPLHADDNGKEVRQFVDSDVHSCKRVIAYNI